MIGILRYWVCFFLCCFPMMSLALSVDVRQAPYPQAYTFGPIVFEERLLGVVSDQLVARDPQLGVSWSQSVGNDDVTAFEMQFNQVFVGGKTLQVFDAQYGYRKWQFSDARVVSFQPAYPYVVIETEGAVFRVLDFLTGQQLWQRRYRGVQSWSVDGGSRQLRLKTSTAYWSVDMATGERVPQKDSLPVSGKRVVFHEDTHKLVITEHGVSDDLKLPTPNQGGYTFYEFNQAGLAVSDEQIAWIDYANRRLKLFEGNFKPLLDKTLLSGFLYQSGRHQRLILVTQSAGIFQLIRKQPKPLRRGRSRQQHPARRSY